MKKKKKKVVVVVVMVVKSGVEKRADNELKNHAKPFNKW